MPTFHLGQLEKDRKAVFDIFCNNDKKEYFLVEMQRAKEPFFVDRSLFYSTFPIQSQAPQGLWDFNLKPVYVVSILDFNIFEAKEDAEHVIEHVYLMRERTRERFSKKLNFVYVELPKFNKAITELETNMDRWLFCLKNLQSLDRRPQEVQGRVFERLFKAAEIKQLTSLSPSTWQTFQVFETWNVFYEKTLKNDCVGRGVLNTPMHYHGRPQGIAPTPDSYQ